MKLKLIPTQTLLGQFVFCVSAMFPCLVCEDKFCFIKCVVTVELLKYYCSEILILQHCIEHLHDIDSMQVLQNLCLVSVAIGERNPNFL